VALSDWLGRHRAVVWVAAVVLGPVVAAVLTLGRPQLHENHVTLILVLAVAVVSAAGLRPAGLVAAVMTAIGYDYFWTEPYYSLRIFDTQDILTVLLLVLVGEAIEQLSWWAGRQRATAARRLDYLTALRRAAERDARGNARRYLGHNQQRARCRQLSPGTERALARHGAAQRWQRYPGRQDDGRRPRRPPHR
jgi:K+-sensing histidine kinase KdpD